MKHTPSQFFCALMENQWQARYTDEQMVKLLEKFNERKYRSGAKIISQNRRAYNRGELPGQEGKPDPVPKYDKWGNSQLKLSPKKGRKS